MVLLQIRSNGQITLPASVRRLAELNEGDVVEVVVETDGSVRLIPKLIVDRSQTHLLSRKEQEGEQVAAKIAGTEIVEKRIERVDDALSFLDD